MGDQLAETMVYRGSKRKDGKWKMEVKLDSFGAKGPKDP
jgi:hypothetical protein